MDKIELVIKLALAVGGFLVAAIPSVIGIIKAIKDRKNAANLAAKEAANNDLLNQLNAFIQEAEEAYANVNAVLKARGESAGSAKKESVLSKLREYALDHGYDFDSVAWGEKIDEVVALTRKVNATVSNVATIASAATQLFKK